MTNRFECDGGYVELELTEQGYETWHGYAGAQEHYTGVFKTRREAVAEVARLSRKG